MNAVARRAGAPIPDDLSHESAHDHRMELLPDELVMLRKTWDIGLQQIVYQTVIQLDGDVITRIQSAFAEPNERNRHLLEIHTTAVATSTAFWKGLVDLIGSFLSGIVHLLPGK
jgi:hypothetical protein